MLSINLLKEIEKDLNDGKEKFTPNDTRFSSLNSSIHPLQCIKKEKIESNNTKLNLLDNRLNNPL